MKVYLDNAATTPMHPKVLEKMLPFLKEYYGNPSSIHGYGRSTRVAIEEAREFIAETINADPGEIYFVSSGTEANNFPIFGIAKTEFEDSGRKNLITTQVEHPCVLEAFQVLEKQGFSVSFVPVDKNSEVNYELLKDSIDGSTSLVSVIHINNETGTVNDIKRISQLKEKSGFYLHTDAVQSFGKINIDVKETGIDSLSVSAHKFNGPKGMGFTYAKSGTPLSPMIFGGSQERNRRGGTENAAGIIGMAEAVKQSIETIDERKQIVSRLRKRFTEGIKNIDRDNIEINGSEKTFPYLANLTFKNNAYKNDAEGMLMYLDINGIAASNGAACTSGTLKPSHVILSMGKSKEDAAGTIRFSFGAQNTEDEIDYALDVLKNMSQKFRR